MLAIDAISSKHYRSTRAMSAKDMAPIIEMLRSSEVLDRYDRLRKPENRDLKFDAVQMLTLDMFIEVRQTTAAGFLETLDKKGGAMIMKNLGMPKGKDGKYIHPSAAWVSDFKNHELPKFKKELEAEIALMVMGVARLRADGTVIMTVDSTPLEASRYSKWADYNGHYRIKMGKAHIIMVQGIPMWYLFTNGNVGDNPTFHRLLDRMSGQRLDDVVLTADGSYNNWLSYSMTYQKTGLVLCTNTGKRGKKHDNATYGHVLKRYQKQHGNPDFINSKQCTPDRIIRYQISHDEEENTGWFLRNLDMSRGDVRKDHLARRRHICETVHHAMKRWVRFDVRGLHARYVGMSLAVKMFTCQLLCVMFPQYTG